MVTPHFLRTLNVQLTRGRELTEAEGEARQPVAIVSEGMAERFWPGEDAVGRQFRLTDPEITDSFTIVGVIRNIRHFQVDPIERETAHGRSGDGTQVAVTLRSTAGWRSPTVVDVDAVPFFPGVMRGSEIELFHHSQMRALGRGTDLRDVGKRFRCDCGHRIECIGISLFPGHGTHCTRWPGTMGRRASKLVGTSAISTAQFPVQHAPATPGPGRIIGHFRLFLP